MQEVVITGIGPMLPNCDDRRVLWQHLRDGQSQLAFEVDPSDPNAIAPMGRIHGFDPARHLCGLPERFYSRYGRSHLLYVASLLAAYNDAKLDADMLRSDRVGLFSGTSRDNFEHVHARTSGTSGTYAVDDLSRTDLPSTMPGMAVGLAASMLGIRGPTYTYAGTCAAGGVAVGHALRELERGDIDVAFATGHDSSLVAPVYTMYKDAGLLSEEREDATRAVRPYGEHSKNAFGEGAVTLVLETRDHAEARGADILADLIDYGAGNNGFHPTHVDSTGLRPAELIERVLDRGHVRRDQVGFVVGHGNAVEGSDRSELRYMARVFGDRAEDVPLLSTKPIYGHVLGASAALSVAAATLMIHNQYVVPTINVDVGLTTPGFSHQANRGRRKRCEAGLVVSYGMGGQNIVLLLRRPEGIVSSRRAA